MAALLHTETTGSSDRTAVVVHGLSGDGTDWWPVVPHLVAAGYRVVTVDLPGHGRSAPAPDLTIDDAAAALRASVPAEPALAIGASMGALVLGAAVTDLRPDRVVYVDPPFVVPAVGDDGLLDVVFTSMQEERTLANLRRSRPDWDDEARRIRAEAAARWHVPTAVALYRSIDGTDRTPPWVGRPLVIRPDPSRYVSGDDVARLEQAGFVVRSLPGAAHTPWQDHLDDFIAALDGWL